MDGCGPQGPGPLGRVSDDSADRRVDEFVTHYAPQILAYTRAWSDLQSDPVTEVLLVFTSPLQVLSLGSPPGQRA